ncbi:MAG: transketolase C-terminal domain-containing protein, partial [Terriglobia bacterium]
VFDDLDGPVVRVTAPDTPVPFSPPLEEYFLPNVQKVVEAARTLAAY